MLMVSAVCLETTQDKMNSSDRSAKCFMDKSDMTTVLRTWATTDKIFVTNFKSADGQNKSVMFTIIAKR